jgi:hypothetical protein
MFGGDKDKFLQTAVDCIDIARGTQDEQTRVALIVLAQQWLDLAQNGSEDNDLVGALQAGRQGSRFLLRRDFVGRGQSRENLLWGQEQSCRAYSLTYRPDYESQVGYTT